MTFDRKLFEDAHAKFIDDATKLTDSDIAQIAIVDPKLGERARARRAGYVPADADTPEERKLMETPLTHDGDDQTRHRRPWNDRDIN